MKTQMRLRRVFKLSEEARLLHRVLPRGIIERIGRGEVIADDHACVTVLFTDVVGFTEMSAATDTASVLTFLNTMFDSFGAGACSTRIGPALRRGACHEAACAHRAA